MMDLTAFHADYRTALRAAIWSGNEVSLGRADELGLAAAEAGILPTALLSTHQAVVAEALAGGGGVVATERATAFLAAFLAPIERGYLALAEEARSLAQLPEVLLEGVPAIVYVSSWRGEPGEMLYVSPQSEAVLGYATPDWLAAPTLWLDRLALEDRDRVVAERSVAHGEGRAFVAEYRLLARDGRPVWFHDEAHIVRDDAGQPLFWKGVLLDITQRKAAEQEAAAAERLRLAQDLHDSVTQTLLGVTIHARTLPKVWSSDPAAAVASLAELEALAATALAEMRTLLLELRPTELTRVALHHLLGQIVAARPHQQPPDVQLSVDPLPLLPPEVQVVFYRVAQEALNNVARHAAATSAQVVLRDVGDAVTLTITDDGRGFDPAGVPAGHLGIRGMQERAEAIAAQLTVDAERGRGTHVRLRWQRPR